MFVLMSHAAGAYDPTTPATVVSSHREELAMHTVRAQQILGGADPETLTIVQLRNDAAPRVRPPRPSYAFAHVDLTFHAATRSVSIQTFTPSIQTEWLGMERTLLNEVQNTLYFPFVGTEEELERRLNDLLQSIVVPEGMLLNTVTIRSLTTPDILIEPSFVLSSAQWQAFTGHVLPVDGEPAF